MFTPNDFGEKMKIVIAGVPGAGKTTILKYLRDYNVDFIEVNFGDIMFDIAKKEYKINDRDKMRTELNEEKQKEIQTKASEKIAKMDGNIIVNTHAAIRMSEGRYLNGLPAHVAKALKPDYIILLEYPPKYILERRRGDATRTREMETEEEIERHQQLNYEFARKASKFTNCKVERISLRFNEEEPFHHAKFAAKKIKEIMVG